MTDLDFEMRQYTDREAIAEAFREASEQRWEWVVERPMSKEELDDMATALSNGASGKWIEEECDDA